MANPKRTRRANPKRTRRANFQRLTADVSHGACASPVFSVGQFCRRNPYFTEGSLRWKIFHASTNGLDASGAIIRDGRQIAIDEPRFFAWFRSGGKTAP
jgi:hypothetical protein